MSISGVNQAPNHHNNDEIGKLESSSRTMTKIRNFVSKIFIDIWRTLGSYFLKVDIPSEAINQFLKNNESSDIKPAMKQLQKKKRIGPSAVEKYCDYLKNKKGNFQPIYSFLHDEMKTSINELPAAQGNNHFIFIPIVIKGYVDHIVTMLVDREKNQIEYYDSKGVTSKDRGSVTIRGFEGEVIMSALLKGVRKRYGDDLTIWENANKQQYDSHNCGVYVLRYFERRLNGESFEHITTHPEKFSKINNSIRADLITNLHQDYIHNLPKSPPPENKEVEVEDDFMLISPGIALDREEDSALFQVKGDLISQQ